MGKALRQQPLQAKCEMTAVQRRPKTVSSPRSLSETAAPRDNTHQARERPSDANFKGPVLGEATLGRQRRVGGKPDTKTIGPPLRGGHNYPPTFLYLVDFATFFAIQDVANRIATRR